MAQCVWNPIAGFLLEAESACQENQVLCLLGDRSSGKSKALEHLLCTSADDPTMGIMISSQWLGGAQLTLDVSVDLCDCCLERDIIYIYIIYIDLYIT